MCMYHNKRTKCHKIKNDFCIQKYKQSFLFFDENKYLILFSENNNCNSSITKLVIL